MAAMDVRRLRLLLELSRLGSMHEVADELGTTTSAVSQGSPRWPARSARRWSSPTAAGCGSPRPATGSPSTRSRSCAAVEAARLDLDPDAEPAGVLRVAGFATAIRRSLLPAMDDLARSHPGVEVRVHEYEPLEAFDLLARDDIDLALTYDYNLAPASWRSDHEVADAVERRLGPRRARPRERRAAVRVVRRPRLDRELPQHRRRGGAAHARVDGGLHARASCTASTPWSWSTT